MKNEALVEAKKSIANLSTWDGGCCIACLGAGEHGVVWDEDQGAAVECPVGHLSRLLDDPRTDSAPLTAVVPMSPVFDPTLASETATPTTYQLALEVFAAATLAMIDDACPLSGDDWVIPHETVEIWKKARHALALATPTGSDDT